MNANTIKNRIVRRIKKKYSDTVEIFNVSKTSIVISCKDILDITSCADSFIGVIDMENGVLDEYFNIDLTKRCDTWYVIATLQKDTRVLDDLFDIDAFFNRLDNVLIDVKRYKKKLMLKEIEDE